MLPEAEHAALDHFDAYVYIIFSPIGIACSLSLFLGHVFSNRMRKQPWDLITMVCLCEIIFGVHGLVTALSSDYFYQITFGTLSCIVQGAVVHTSFSLELGYNSCFVIALYIQVYLPHFKSVSSWIYHIICWLLGGIFLALNLFTKSYGRNSYGVCEIKSVSIYTISIGMTLLFLLSILTIIVYRHAKTAIPSHSRKSAQLKRNFVNFYFGYLRVLISLCLIINFSYLMQYLTNKDYMDYKIFDITIGDLAFVIGKIGSSAKVLAPLLLFLTRLGDPLIAQTVWIPYKSKIEKLIKGPYYQEKKLFDWSGDQQELHEFEEELKSDLNDMTWIGYLGQILKSSIYRTILGSILTYYPIALENGDIGLAMDPIRTKAEQELAIFRIDGRRLMEQLDCDDRQLLLSCKATIYAPTLFNRVITSSGFTIDQIIQSLGILQNERKITNVGADLEGSGGRSGEIFIITEDRKFLLKTISQTDCKNFLDMLAVYSLYLECSSKSKIARILGMFKFEFFDSSRSIQISLMEIIDPIPPIAILRKYDLKGSRMGRKVLTSRKTLEISLNLDGSRTQEILKDNDFEELEKKITLPAIQRRELINFIKTDIFFLTKQGMIDYSLILTVARADLVPITSDQNSSRIYRWKDKVYYIGIIDYLQRYTLSKWLEKHYKMMTRCNSKMSSQPPGFYGKRFIKQIEKYVIDDSIDDN